jgi:hypothetical protein
MKAWIGCWISKVFWKLELAWYIAEMNKAKPGLYANINARRKAGTSRPKSKSTIQPKVWRMMKAKKGGFEPR